MEDRQKRGAGTRDAPPTTSASPWLGGARRCPSPNFDARPAGARIELIVIHGISLPPGCFGTGHVDALFTNALDPDAHPEYEELCAMRVSSHLLIDRTGACVQYVPFDARAWHAGLSEWCGRSGCNDFSIGIELEGTDDVPYTDAQYATLATVVGDLRRRYPDLSDTALVGHADIAPGRKTDPGPAFDWDRLRDLLA
ncbi:MAG TPA: 1,6-anhydro-N-acetylmuramyl-L-alanine amidase AmpD [Pseudomonadales bacterium]|nr:1,6-anhydro-N-acetylmuramyl-L-alanine amidase AmpD [Pseudomonadales bacterium]